MKMLNDCYKYAKAINAKGQPFPIEPVIMTLLFSQHKLIEWLEAQISGLGGTGGGQRPGTGGDDGRPGIHY